MAPTTRNRGADFVRSGIALALAGGNREQAIRVAETRWGGDAMAARIVGRAAVPAAAVGGVWAGQLAEAAGEGREFYSSVSEASVFLRLPGVRRLPAGVKAVATVSGTSAEWRGQGTAYPVSSAVFDVRAINLLDLRSPRRCHEGIARERRRPCRRRDPQRPRPRRCQRD